MNANPLASSLLVEVSKPYEDEYCLVRLRHIAFPQLHRPPFSK